MKTKLLFILTSMLINTALATEEVTQTQPQKPAIDLAFIDAPLNEILQTTYSQILNEQLVIDANDLPKVSINLTNITNEKLKKITDDLLNQNGYIRIEESGISTIKKRLSSAEAADKLSSETVTHYKSKYRNLDETTKLLSLIGIKSVSDGDTIYLAGDTPRITAAINLLRNYDKPIDDIVIKASVIEFNDSANSGFNIFAFLSSKNLSISAGTNLLMRDSIKFVTSSFSFVLSKIEEDSRFNVLNTSIQRVINGKQSRLSIGSDVPVLSQFSQTTTGQPVQNVEYRSSGLILDVLPKMINNFVTADLTQELSSFSETTSSSINSPTLTKRQMRTSLSAKLNEVILIGGLETSQTNSVKSTIFGLPIGSTERENKSTLYLLIEFSKT